MRLLSSTNLSLLLPLLPSVSSLALPGLPDCWRDCVTQILPCKDRDWRCESPTHSHYRASEANLPTLAGFCRQARDTPLLSSAISCIHSDCDLNPFFDPSPLLGPFINRCPRVAANESLLASLTELAHGSPTSSAAAAAAAVSDNEGAEGKLTTTTTFLGIATAEGGILQSFTVPALVGPTGTVFGAPVTEGTNPTSTVTLPWPTLPPNYFLTRAGNEGGGGAASVSVTREIVVAAPVPASGKTSTVISSAGAASAPQETGRGDMTTQGTILDSENKGVRAQGQRGSLLGLMVGVMVGVVWF
ncbi:MAG: hypothetical protein LQ351_006381 [Letrouitia transgressa]|nr:MAG: hypothetical protein LQ351_006381 [Letrouitia transgressa]